METSTCIRAKILEPIPLDLVGPRNDHAFAHELLSHSPQTVIRGTAPVGFAAALCSLISDGE
jgi:hypothetical protein